LIFHLAEFFQKQAEEKQIRRISLTAIKTDDQLIKRLAPRISRLYNGWQPSDTRKRERNKEYQRFNTTCMKQ
jgi:hypothetical protein